MNIASTTQYKTALEYRSRLAKMSEVARTTLGPRDLIYFERSLQNLIEQVDRQIDAYQGEVIRVLSPTWVTLGEFVVNGRVLQPPEGALVWNAFVAPIQSCAFGALVTFQQPALFEITRSTDSPNAAGHLSEVFNLHGLSHPSAS